MRVHGLIPMAPPQFLSCFEEQLRRTKVTAIGARATTIYH
jgi:hypothetical protein